jgi:hypothetical protein
MRTEPGYFRLVDGFSFPRWSEQSAGVLHTFERTGARGSLSSARGGSEESRAGYVGPQVPLSAGEVLRWPTGSNNTRATHASDQDRCTCRPSQRQGSIFLEPMRNMGNNAGENGPFLFPHSPPKPIRVRPLGQCPVPCPEADNRFLDRMGGAFLIKRGHSASPRKSY